MPTLQVDPAPSTSVATRHSSDPMPMDVELFAEEMVRRWRAGERPTVEEFLDRCPELRDRADATLELLAEELALRSEFGMETHLRDLNSRFPRWPAQIAALVECQRALGSHTAKPLLPAAGEQLGDFHLVSILGRGAQGQVYLAAQTTLANRPVVLKLGPSEGEHLCLARLQHSYIVPLYSAHDFPERGLHGLCMPYFGGITLAELLTRIESKPERPLKGRDLLAELSRAHATPLDETARSPSRSFLEHASATEIICWMGACLAEALQYAHDRGLLHLDVKPSNVLIAADGTPMLLDFHLARPPLRQAEPAPARLGGTSGFMPPEQVEAMHAVASGGTLPQAVDVRADVYALGVLLEHSLRKFSGRDTPASTAIADILSHCTATKADDRYPSAAALATDLRRHLSDLPLRGVRNRNIAERWTKWRRRRPYALPFVMTLAALMLVALGLLIRAGQHVRGAGEALGNGERHLAEHRYREAGESFRGGEALISGIAGQRELRERLQQGRVAAERGQMAADLHALCEQVRPLYGMEATNLHAVAEHCRTLWDQRDAIRRQLAAFTSSDKNWQSDLLDLGILTAHIEVTIAGPERREAASRKALTTLDEAEQLFGPSGVLYLERARFARELGMHIEAEESMKQYERTAPQTGWEHLVIGRAELAAGHFEKARHYLDRSLSIDPQSLWANYYKGQCSLQQGQPTEALAAFSACVALAPESPWCIHNRGLAFMKSDRLESAMNDFNRAIELDPNSANAYRSRAALHQQAGRSAEAQADLKRAAELGAR